VIAAASAVAPRLADGTGAPLYQSVTSFLAIGAFAFGWIAFRRLSGRGFPRVSRGLAFGAAALAVVCVVLIFVLPPILNPAPASVRPRSTATIRILSPAPGETFHAPGGNPVRIPVRLVLKGGEIVPFTSQHLTANQGHVHLFIDGRLVSMSYSLNADVWVPPGAHRLVAEFVAVDHGPFDPQVEASVAFRVVG